MDSCRDKAIGGEPTNILIMGGPGAGKGTMPAKIIGKLNANHISTGNIFRNEAGKGTAFGMKTKNFMDRGLLVPDEAINNMVKSYLEELEDKKNGFLPDGYPRTLDQVKVLGALAEGNEFAIDKVITLGIDFEKLADRVTGCRICKECGEAYHIKSKPSKTDNVYDVCGGELFQCKDDTVESLTVRPEEYNSQTIPVLDYYGSKGVITRVSASQPTGNVWSGTLTVLEKQEW